MDTLTIPRLKPLFISCVAYSNLYQEKLYFTLEEIFDKLKKKKLL